MVNQDLAHCARRQPEEMAAVGELALGFGDQAQERVVNQRGGIHRQGIAAQDAASHALELGVHVLVEPLVEELPQERREAQRTTTARAELQPEQAREGEADLLALYKARL